MKRSSAALAFNDSESGVCPPDRWSRFGLRLSLVLDHGFALVLGASNEEFVCSDLIGLSARLFCVALTLRLAVVWR